LLALFDCVKKNNLNVVLHAISDGRDTKPQVFLDDLKVLVPILNNCNVKLGTIGGRFFGMDRDNNFDRVKKYYDAIVCNDNSNEFNDCFEYVQDFYKKNILDEFIEPAFNKKFSKSEISLKDNDAVIFFNFRPDRAREMSHLIKESSLYQYKNEWKKNIFFVTMMNYEGIIPNAIAFPPMEINNCLGKIIETNSLSQLRIAETEKYAHVTFFFDGGKDITYKDEKKIIIDSPKVKTYDLMPQMSAYKICDEIINSMDKYDVIIANFANGDMVGHTGNFEATKKAVAVVDECIGKIYKKSLETNTTLFITADHGNADIMLDDNDEMVTSHTISPVPLIITDKDLNIKKGRLANIAPTILKYLKIEIPSEFEEPII
jgi:2,3-bisphosphoglycerate-independent phosphoglycerate mutase